MKSQKYNLNILSDSTVNNIFMVIVMETMIITTKCAIILLGAQKERKEGHKKARNPHLHIIRKKQTMSKTYHSRDNTLILFGNMGAITEEMIKTECRGGCFWGAGWRAGAEGIRVLLFFVRSFQHCLMLDCMIKIIFKIKNSFSAYLM